MTATHKNFLKTTISAVASSGLGDFTIDAASSGYRTFGAGDDGLTFDGISIVEGTAWEVRDGCVYTHSGTSLSRGTLQDSSTGSAIAFTSAAIVEQNPSAGLAGRIEQVALVRATGGDSSITLAPNTHYTWDLSTLTADRTGTLPTTAAVGDAIEISATTNNASYELILSTGSGQTCALGGTVVAASTEITRLIMAGESMRFVYEATNKWVAEDGRIPMHGKITLSTAVTTNTAATYEFVTDVGGAFTSEIDVGNVVDASTGRINIRRACKGIALISGRTNSTVGDNKFANYGISINGSGTPDYNQFGTGGGGFLTVQVGGGYSKPFAAGDYIRYILRTEEANKGLAANAQSCMSFVEVLS